MDGFVKLAEIRREVGARCEAIEEGHGRWLCRAGCDGCCRSLARLPELTGVEWAEVERGLGELDGETRRAIAGRMAQASGPPFACPFLDEAAGRCLIYEHRPVVCRTYGYYVEREGGRYCAMIREQVESGAMDGVVWGNQEAVDERLKQLGGRAGLEEWRRLTGLILFKRS